MPPHGRRGVEAGGYELQGDCKAERWEKDGELYDCDVERRDEEAFKFCAFYVTYLKDYFYRATVRMFRNPT